MTRWRFCSVSFSSYLHRILISIIYCQLLRKKNVWRNTTIFKPAIMENSLFVERSSGLNCNNTSWFALFLSWISTTCAATFVRQVDKERTFSQVRHQTFCNLHIIYSCFIHNVSDIWNIFHRAKCLTWFILFSCSSVQAESSPCLLDRPVCQVLF